MSLSVRSAGRHRSSGGVTNDTKLNLVTLRGLRQGSEELRLLCGGGSVYSETPSDRTDLSGALSSLAQAFCATCVTVLPCLRPRMCEPATTADEATNHEQVLP